jgi:Zn-finger nucleic acid-binding protein
MRCPVDGTTLALAERAGVEVDYCPECRGVWLDRGELDRVVERSARGGYDRERGRDDDRGHDHEDHELRHHGDHEWLHYDDDECRGDRYDQPPRKRGGAFGALSDLLGGGGSGD